MADQYAISAANLKYIESGLNSIHQDLEVVTHGVGTVNDNVKVVYDEIGTLANEFHEFVQIQKASNNKQESLQRLIQIHQEMEKNLVIMKM